MPAMSSGVRTAEELRMCPPVPEIEIAAKPLDEVASVHLKGDFNHFENLVIRKRTDTLSAAFR